MPTGVVGSGGNTTINIVFTAPASNGSGAITGYTVTSSASGSGRTGTATSSPIRVTGLTNGTAYTCSVVATNSAGPSPASSAVTVTPLGVPAAPTGVVAAPSADECEHCLHGPASTGGAPITSYIVTCTEASAPLTGTGATSPITVSGMTSGTTYTCVVAAISAAGTGTASTAVSVTAIQPATGLTSAVGCTLSYTVFNNSPKVNNNSVSSWSCSGTHRALSGNGIPDHAVVGGNFATPMSAQVITQQFSLNPVNTGTVTSTMIVGYALNSVKFDAGTAGTRTSNATSNVTSNATSNASSTTPSGGCVAIAGQDPWRIEALGRAFTFGTDKNNAHVQSEGAYHYHGMPIGINTRTNKGETMTLVVGRSTVSRCMRGMATASRTI